MNPRKIYLGLAIVTAINIAFSILYVHLSQKRVVQVDGEVIFNEFVMTKELRTEYENTINARSAILDSMYLNIQLVTNAKAPAAQIEVLTQMYVRKKEQFDQQNQELTKKYDEQVWGRIKQYIKEFAAMNKYSIVLATNASSTVLYSGAEIDKTKQFVDYMNTTYQGIK